MRRILIETAWPWKFSGYMVVGPGVRPGTTRLRYEALTIDDASRVEDRKAEIVERAPDADVWVSELRW